MWVKCRDIVALVCYKKTHCAVFMSVSVHLCPSERKYSLH